ncbi:hypothetical protein CLV84_4334 [Neolewinella xylanilytica]|uniref:Uncharacterized protein n=1 Tax=Neolewinella xylanilytica TaxID=1514080 RepID=A0A2S6HZM9_9BACT|nr:hypothetical protein [Neolewinella xylanilytica]PPK83788.1 hypothetical protein CLV84_4334 [Neolewinella xylanilytica]
MKVLKIVFLTIVGLVVSLEIVAQVSATTEDGRKVLLNEDGSWEYTNHSFLGNRESNKNLSVVYLDGIEFNVNNKVKVYGDSPLYGKDLFIQFGKSNGRKVIIFWQSLNFNPRDEVWTGNVLLYTNNNKVLKFTDRNINGVEKREYKLQQVSGSSSPLFGTIKNTVYERYSVYYLTNSEIDILKQASIRKIVYKTNDPFNTHNNTVEITMNEFTAKFQLENL